MGESIQLRSALETVCHGSASRPGANILSPAIDQSGKTKDSWGAWERRANRSAQRGSADAPIVLSDNGLNTSPPADAHGSSRRSQYELFSHFMHSRTSDTAFPCSVLWPSNYRPLFRHAYFELDGVAQPVPRSKNSLHMNSADRQIVMWTLIIARDRRLLRRPAPGQCTYL